MTDAASTTGNLDGERRPCLSDRRIVSIIVPVLDEEAGVTGLLDHLAELPGRWEVILADGGSGDATRELSTQHHSHPLIVDAPCGRAGQMNAGAATASGEVLLFLHADTRLPPNAYASLTRALADQTVLGGNFTLRFDGGDRFSRLLGAWYALQRRAGVYYGDSAIWLRRDAFDRLGGFRPLPIMEDYDLVRRLERAGRTACLPGPAITSARRWQRYGLTRTIASWVLIRWLFIAGASPARLARLYPHVR
jgi:rSAM/selenodomain-associated transferase 2